MITVADFRAQVSKWLVDNAARFASHDPTDTEAGRAFRTELWDVGWAGVDEPEARTTR